jgi:hypothetical protein
MGDGGGAAPLLPGDEEEESLAELTATELGLRRELQQKRQALGRATAALEVLKKQEAGLSRKMADEKSQEVRARGVWGGQWRCFAAHE